MKRVFFIMAFVMVSVALSAQQPNKARIGREQVYSLMAEQIAKDLDIKDDIKQKFVTLYLSYAEASQRRPQTMRTQAGQEGNHPQNDRQQQGVRPQGDRHQQGARPQSPQNDKDLTDEQIEAKILQSYDLSIKAIELKKSYYYKFREFLTPHQINNMYEAERGFRSRILNEQMRRE